MARSKSGGTRSYIRGRIGADVYAIGKDGKGTKQQVARSLAEEVANPRTLAQQRSRMIMNGVAQLVRALKPIISHSFDGIPAGQPSVSHFRKLAFEAFNADALLVSPQFGYLAKDSKLIPNGEIQISSGKATIPCLYAWNRVVEDGMTYPGRSLYLAVKGPQYGLPTSYHQIADELFGQHQDVVLTFVNCCVDNYSNPTQVQCYLDQVKLKDNLPDTAVNQNTLGITKIFDLNTKIFQNNVINLYSDNTNGFRSFVDFQLLNTATRLQKRVVAGVIISKKVAGKWIHSDSKLFMNFCVSGNPYSGSFFNDFVQASPFQLSFADALATYPVGTAHFLDGGDM